jgi:tetratricopeptide (TPR) repeat protein
MSRSNRGLSVGIQQQQYNPNVSPVRPMTSTSTSVRRSPASGTGQMGLPSVSPTAPPSSRSSRPNRRYSSDLTTPDYLRTPDLPQHSQPDSFEDRYVVIDPHQEIMRQLSAGNSTASHLAALQGLDDDADLNPLSETDHLASLAPERPGMLQRAMLRGEAAFREGDYRTALSAFSTAMALSYRSPEALLSLARTEFAAGQYRLGGMHIAEALQVLPELVLLDIQPQNYYDEVDLYHDHRAALEERVANEPWNFETNLLLAYHRLRADRLDEVREPLSRALALAKFQNNEDAEDAVLILWDGLQARNPGPGKLQPAELPDLFKPLDENDINKTSEAG